MINALSRFFASKILRQPRDHLSEVASKPVVSGEFSEVQHEIVPTVAEAIEWHQVDYTLAAPCSPSPTVTAAMLVGRKDVMTYDESIHEGLGLSPLEDFHEHLSNQFGVLTKIVIDGCKMSLFIGTRLVAVYHALQPICEAVVLQPTVQVFELIRYLTGLSPTPEQLVTMESAILTRGEKGWRVMIPRKDSQTIVA